MIGKFKMLVAFIVSWMFFFPLTFTFLPPSINSKMFVALLGVVFVLLGMSRRKDPVALRKDIMLLTFIAGVFSISCYLSIVINETTETDYATYIVSMFVWMFAALGSYRMMNIAHKQVSIETVCNYVIALCTVQALLAFAFSLFPSLYSAFSSVFVIGRNLVTWENRLYGLGTSSDVGGIRFAACLIILSYMSLKEGTTRGRRLIYGLCYVIVFFLGNLMSRTTTVGAVVGIIYILVKNVSFNGTINRNLLMVLKVIVPLVIISIPLVIYLYYKLDVAHDLIHFGFEAFFNLFDSGELRTNSSDNLLDMWSTWPDNLHTWIIGDGHFLDPNDPSKFYMRTDVGYARFIFYCGLSGLVLFCLFFISLYSILKKRFPEYTQLFALLVFFQFLVWIKVSTDIFFLLTLFLVADFETEDQNVEAIES